MIISTENAEHFIWGDNCDGWHLLLSDSLSVIQERMPPGTSEQLHYHERAQQVFYILSGKATFEIEGEIKSIEANQSVAVQPGSKHRILNDAEVDLHFLVISEPKTRGDRINI